MALLTRTQDTKSLAMKNDRARLLAAGFDGYISKPVDIKTFPDEVRRVCDRNGQEA